MENKLTTILKLTPSEIFEEGQLLDLVSEIEKEVKSIVIDHTSAKGRDDIKSLAYKVAQTKTFVDKTRKAYIDDKQEFIKKVNAHSKTAVERLQTLQDEVRKPVTDFENAEKERVANIKKSIDEVIRLRSINGLNSIDEINFAISKAESFDATSGKDEFTHHAIKEKEETLNYLSGVLIAREEYEEKETQRIELLRKEQERLQKERDEALIARAKEDAEKEAQRKIDNEKERIQKEADAKILEAKKEQERIAKEAQDKINKEKEELEKKKKEEENIALQEKERAKSIEHQKKINNEIKSSLMREGCIEDLAISITKSIIQGKIPNVFVRY